MDKQDDYISISGFQRAAYMGMSSKDKCYMYIAKAAELVEIGKLFTDEDKRYMSRIIKMFEEAAP